MSESKTGARVVARRVLHRVEQGGAYTTLALSAEMQRSRLTEKDRRLATEICYGVLRHRSRIDRALGAYAHKGLKKLPPPVLLALRVAAYQLLFLDRVPDHAAVDDAVTEVRRGFGPKLAGFVNGLLRKLIRAGEPALPEGGDRESVMVRHSMPDWLVDLIVQRVGSDKLAEAAKGMQSVAPLCVRVNRQRASTEEVASRLREAEGATVAELPHYPWALQVSSLGSPEHSQSFAEGLWTVQDPAAQLVGAMAQAQAACEPIGGTQAQAACEPIGGTQAQAACEPIGGIQAQAACEPIGGTQAQGTPRTRVLDACAGVGGKTTHLAEAEPDVHIDALDLSPRKIELLKAGVERLGLKNVHPMVVDATRDDPRVASDYDLVVLDAPCSGLGVLRRHPEQKWESSRKANEDLVTLQAELLNCLSKRVRVGGHLLYSVCTFTKAEGPEQIAAFLEAHPQFVVDPPTESPGSPPWASLLGEDGAFQSWPHESNMDAFYAVRLRRER